MVTLAIVGATGLVGQQSLACLEENENLSKKIGKIRLFASERSQGNTYLYKGEELVVEDLGGANFKGIDYAIFAVGGDLAAKIAPVAVKAGCIVVDNSSAHRYLDEVPLVVPEVNAKDLENHKGIIANPNCSTAQLVVALAPIHKTYQIKRLVVSTYQAASGAGSAGEEVLLQEVQDDLNDLTLPHNASSTPTSNVHKRRLAFNVIPQIDYFLENGYTREEMKVIWETRKILHAPEIEISATAVRVPVFRGHSESVTIDLAHEVSHDKICDLLRSAPGVKLLESDDFENYPTPLDAAGNNTTWVGRVRRDLDRLSTIHFWVVSDNLRKGAAYNAVQIVETLLEKP